MANIAWSDQGFSGVIHVTFQASASGDGTTELATAPIGRGERGAFGLNSGETFDFALNNPGEGSLILGSIVFTAVSDDTPGSVKFASVYLGNGEGDQASLNGVLTTDIDVSGVTTEVGRNDLESSSGTVEFRTIDTNTSLMTGDSVSINGVRFEIKAIPEPSTGLLGFLSLGLIPGRRR